MFDFADFSAFGIETAASSPYFIFEAETAPGQSFFSRSKSGMCLSCASIIMVKNAEVPAADNEDVQYVMYLGTNGKDTNEPVFDQSSVLIQANKTETEFYSGD